MALGAEEGRGKLRKVTGISKHKEIREYPNGAIRMRKLMHHILNKIGI